MTKQVRQRAMAIAVGAALAGAMLGFPSAAMADDVHRDSGNVMSPEKDQHEQGGETGIQEATAALSGSQEDPLVIATPGEGKFWAKINEDKEEIEYKLSYEELTSDAAAAHIHFGGKAQSGGIIAFLCNNGNTNSDGADVPECPPGDGEINGVLTPESVIGPANQGINPGEFEKLVEAIEEGVAYVNVHTEQFPNGEIRGQVELKEPC
jgi:hypothetical protein